MMKIFFIILVVTMSASMCACTSSAERKLHSLEEEAEQSREIYEDAVRQSQELKRDIEDLHKAYDRINSAK